MAVMVWKCHEQMSHQAWYRVVALSFSRILTKQPEFIISNQRVLSDIMLCFAPLGAGLEYIHILHMLASNQTSHTQLMVVGVGTINIPYPHEIKGLCGKSLTALRAMSKRFLKSVVLKIFILKVKNRTPSSLFVS